MTHVLARKIVLFYAFSYRGLTNIDIERLIQYCVYLDGARYIIHTPLYFTGAKDCLLLSTIVHTVPAPEDLLPSRGS